MKCRWLRDALFRFVDAAHDGDKKVMDCSSVHEQ